MIFKRTEIWLHNIKLFWKHVKLVCLIEKLNSTDSVNQIDFANTYTFDL